MTTLSDKSGMSLTDHFAFGGQLALYMDIATPILKRTRRERSDREAESEARDEDEGVGRKEERRCALST